MSEYGGHQYVGIDLHRRRSVIVRQTDQGEQLSVVRIVNDPVALGLQIEQAGTRPDVVLEATYGWYWAADVLQAAGAHVHLAHPLGVKGFAYRRVKNDVRDAADLVDLLRMGRLPESWIAPAETRELRELVRYRAKLVALRSGLKAQVHAVLAKARRAHRGVRPVRGRWPCPARADRSVRRLCPARGVPAEADRHPRRGGRPLQPPHRRTTSRSRRLRGHPVAARHRARTGGRAGRRDRRRAPLPLRRPIVFLVRTDPAPLRVRHRRTPRTRHQTGQQAGPLGGRGGYPAQDPPRSRRIGPGSGPAAARTSRRSPRPANCSRWSTTGCATGTAAPWPARPREQLGGGRLAVGQLSDPHPARPRF